MFNFDGLARDTWAKIQKKQIRMPGQEIQVSEEHTIRSSKGLLRGMEDKLREPGYDKNRRGETGSRAGTDNQRLTAKYARNGQSVD